MGNVECQRCITAEREMFAEIILGKNEMTPEQIITTNNKIKKISDQIPRELIAKKLGKKSNKNKIFEKNNIIQENYQIDNNDNIINYNNNSIKNHINDEEKQVQLSGEEVEEEREEQKGEENEGEEEQQYEEEQLYEESKEVEEQYEYEKEENNKNLYEKQNQNSEEQSNYGDNEMENNEEYEIDDYKNPRPSGLSDDENEKE